MTGDLVRNLRVLHGGAPLWMSWSFVKKTPWFAAMSVVIHSRHLGGLKKGHTRPVAGRLVGFGSGDSARSLPPKRTIARSQASWTSSSSEVYSGDRARPGQVVKEVVDLQLVRMSIRGSGRRQQRLTPPATHRAIVTFCWLSPRGDGPRAGARVDLQRSTPWSTLDAAWHRRSPRSGPSDRRGRGETAGRCSRGPIVRMRKGLGPIGRYVNESGSDGIPLYVRTRHRRC